MSSLKAVALLVLVGFLTVSHAALSQEVVFDFVDGDPFDGTSTNGVSTVSGLTLSTHSVTGFVDNTNTSALSTTTDGSHVTYTKLKALAVNSAGTGGYANEFQSFNPGEAWTFAFDQDVTLVELDFASFTEVGTGMKLTSTAFSEIDIQISSLRADESGRKKDYYTFEAGIKVSAGTKITITMTQSGAYNAADSIRIDSFTVATTGTETVSYAVLKQLRGWLFPFVALAR